jgi:hypothetical protein
MSLLPGERVGVWIGGYNPGTGEQRNGCITGSSSLVWSYHYKGKPGRKVAGLSTGRDRRAPNLRRSAVGVEVRAALCCQRRCVRPIGEQKSTEISVVTTQCSAFRLATTEPPRTTHHFWHARDVIDT